MTQARKTKTIVIEKIQAIPTTIAIQGEAIKQSRTICLFMRAKKHRLQQ